MSSTGVCARVQVVRYNLFSLLFFLLGLIMLFLSLPVLGLSLKSTYLSSGFSLCKSRQFLCFLG